MSLYAEERRADRVVEAEQRRIDEAAADARRAARQEVADQRAARLREQRAADKAQAKHAKAQARAARRAARRAALTAGNVYRRGTLALVVASALGSLPAQILHFISISPLLLPLPLAIEGAAWVLAAGVAYADERSLPGWVRWLLRALVVAAAGFAASINYRYGTHLLGLSASDAQTAGMGLAAVTLLGPLLFEIRQWVATLSTKTEDAQAEARRRHDRRRRRQHRSVARVADRLMSAAPFGELSFEDAFERAWEIRTGTPTPGMTPRLHRRAARSLAALATATAPRKPAPADAEATPTTNPAPDPAPETHSPAPALPTPAPRKRPAKPVAKRPARRSLDDVLADARTATEAWPVAELTADRIRQAVNCGAQHARTARDVLRAERDTAAEPVGDAEAVAA
ncbi:hypothetical protein [Streptomyces sp. CA2R106]|uniref:hypothetical protein n=1 Tax=Streptomyces sp. CA2R106 TaxID=3120153 RepID=UPI00300B877E